MSAPASPSPLAEAVRRVGDRWTLLLIEALLTQPLRFGDLQQAVPGIAPNILSQRLRHLEAEGLAVARAYSARPPRAVYELTEEGRELSGALRLLADWGGRRGGVDPPRHAVCGTPLEVRFWCPTCAQPVEADREDLYEV